MRLEKSPVEYRPNDDRLITSWIARRSQIISKNAQITVAGTTYRAETDFGPRFGKETMAGAPE